MYDIFQNYMVCSHHALDLLKDNKSVDDTQVALVVKEAHKNLDQAKDELINLRAAYPVLMRAVDINHCEYYVLKQMVKYYHHLAETGQIDHKHFDMIQEELDEKIKALKLKTKVDKRTLKEKILHS